MTRGFSFLFLVLAVVALLCGAVLKRYASTGWLSRDGQPAPYGSAPVSADNGPSTNDTETNNSVSPAKAEPLHASQSGNPDKPAGTVESFSEWFQKYRKSNQDSRRLRDDLRAALSQLEENDQQENAPDAAAALEALRRAEQTAGNDYASLLDQAERFLESYPTGPMADEVRSLFANYSSAWDDHDFHAARDFSRDNPDRFESRIAHYQEYLERHAVAGQHVADVKRAIETIRSDWSDSDYHAIHDFIKHYPNDLKSTAARVRRFVDDHPSSDHRRAADHFVSQYEKAVAPGEYRLRVKSGKFARTISRNLSFGPDLAVEVEVAGIRIGRTPIVRDSFEPVWNYEFPQNIRWRMGDPIKIRVIDFDYSNRTILKIEPTDDPLAFRNFTGTIAADGHQLTFETNFVPPSLPTP